jgi:DNA-binding CsgD family transcriptional regulator
MKLELTQCEIKVVEYKARGFSAKQICDKLFVTVHTIKQHTKNALRRNALANGFELVARYSANHPELFRNAVVIGFLCIQGLICLDVQNYDFKRSKSKAKTVRLFKAKKY